MSASRETQIAFTSWLTADGMWTDGNSMRHDASLKVRASRWSFFRPRCPTPQRAHQRRGDDPDIMAVLLRLGGHSKRLGAGLHDDAGPRAARQPGHELVRPTPQLFDDVTRAVSNADLTLAAPQVDADVLHDQAPPGFQYYEPPMEAATSSFLVRAPFCAGRWRHGPWLVSFPAPLSASSQCGAEATTSRRGPAASSYLDKDPPQGRAD